MNSTLHPETAEPKSIDKFIAFFDVLGWKSLVLKAELNNSASLKEPIEILDLINQELQIREESFLRNELEICPSSPYKSQDIDFCFTTLSDSAVVSAEVSPVGLANLINCCRVVYFKLILRKGLMCRGYIKRGSIYHTKRYCVGSGLNDVVESEKSVSIFGSNTSKHSTPFIEIDENVLQFIDNEVSDSCVKSVLSDIVKRAGNVAAVFPFSNLTPSVFGDSAIDSEKIRRDISFVRRWIEEAKEMVSYNVDPNVESARQKGYYLIEILNRQLVTCQLMEARLDEIGETFPAHSFEPRHFPGLFDSSSAAKPRK